ncbi:MAG: hypothetical protein ACP5OA_07210 [Candidatus Woesearchaeota archaeon]
MINHCCRNGMSLTKILRMLPFISIVLVSLHPVLGTYITEIMFNPGDADNGREWIELKTNGNECVNLSEYRLYEDETHHNINAFSEEIFCNYAIICNDINKFLQDYYYLNDSINSSINNTLLYKSTFSLSNSGEELAIKKGNEFVDYMNYSILLDQITIVEGYSLEYYDDMWMQSPYIKGDPGNKFRSENKTPYLNDSIEYINNSIDESDVSYNNTSYTDITFNDTNNDNNSTYNITVENNTINNYINYTVNITHNSTDSAANKTYNITNNTTDNTTHDTTNNTADSCSVSIKIYVKNESKICEENINQIYNNNIQIKFYNKLEFSSNINTKNYSIEYWVEDILGNIIKSKVTTNNQDEKSFTPKIDESDKILVIKSAIKSIDCNILNDTDKKILLIKNSEYLPEQCPTCDSCNTKISKCAPCIFDELQENDKICSKIPTIKTVNVCNNSCNDKQQLQAKATQSIQSGSMNNPNNMTNYATTALEDNNSKRNKTAGLTGMVIYESPNLKNRFYAIIGLIFVGLASAIIFIYRLFSSKAEALKDI